MLVKWSRASRRDILDILDYFSSLKIEDTGKRIVSVIMQSTDILSSFPLSGRRGRIIETRELNVKKLPYVIIYRVFDDMIEIARVFHTSRLFPNTIEEHTENSDFDLYADFPFESDK